MWISIARFVWNHFWKMAFALLLAGFWGFVASIQAPGELQADVGDLKHQYQYLHDENMNLKIGLGTNNQLFHQVDEKLDRLMQSQILLAEQVRRAIQR